MTKVLYIGGTGRTGSTVLDRLLGAADGWVSGGELAFFWRHGLVGEGRCSCGEPLRSCPVWARALAILEQTEPLDARRMVALRRRFWSIHLPLMWSTRFTAARLDDLEEFPSTVARLYRAVADVTASSVIVDSSKEPHYSMILRERTDLDIYFLHLVRDPRATGFSWKGRKAEVGFDTTRLMERRGLVKSSVYYLVSNIAAERLWRGHPDRYRLLRYEDFTADPRGCLAAIAAWIGDHADLAVVVHDDRTVEPTTSHLAWGNPNRFDQGSSRVTNDTRWIADQPRWRSAAQFALTGMVARRYGYRRRPGSLQPPKRRSGRWLWSSRSRRRERQT